MKKLIFLTCLILIYTLMNYPLYSEGVSYVIIFSCLVVICFAGEKLFSDQDNNDYDSVEKEMDKAYQEDGIFKYVTDGFYITRKKKTEFIKWEEIQAINSFRIQVLKDYQTGLEIITETKSYEINDNNSPGIEKFSVEMYKNLPITYDRSNLNDFYNTSRLQKEVIYKKKE
ncbi:hypothetical protein [Chryseobacterium sp. CT-SW4]|uniref:hypothetical protein n=1 Tax=Chryseobacterium sp. SW-1 TaxID=3157343 RepID=UPI003B01640C